MCLYFHLSGKNLIEDPKRKANQGNDGFEGLEENVESPPPTDILTGEMIDEKYTEECRHECKKLFDMNDHKETIEKIAGPDFDKLFPDPTGSYWDTKIEKGIAAQKVCVQKCKEGNLPPLVLKVLNLGFSGMITFAKWKKNQQEKLEKTQN